jgi:hypothetical protein
MFWPGAGNFLSRGRRLRVSQSSPEGKKLPAANMLHSEPTGQIAVREMEIVRIRGALQRAEELSDDVAVAIEPAL